MGGARPRVRTGAAHLARTHVHLASYAASCANVKHTKRQVNNKPASRQVSIAIATCRVGDQLSTTRYNRTQLLLLQNSTAAVCGTKQEIDSYVIDTRKNCLFSCSTADATHVQSQRPMFAEVGKNYLFTDAIVLPLRKRASMGDVQSYMCSHLSTVHSKKQRFSRPSISES